MGFIIIGYFNQRTIIFIIQHTLKVTLRCEVNTCISVVGCHKRGWKMEQSESTLHEFNLYVNVFPLNRWQVTQDTDIGDHVAPYFFQR